MGREQARPPLPSVLPRNHAGAEVLGASLAGSAFSDTGCLPPPPALPYPSRTPAPSYWPTPYEKTRTEERTMVITKRMKEPTNHNSPRRHPLPQPAVQSQMLLGPTSPPGPQLSRAHRPLHLGGIARSPHPHSHRARPGRQRLGMVPSRPQGPWPLSLLSLLPLISCRDLGPKAVGTWVWGAEGTATEVRGKPRRVGNKYERVFGGSASLGWNGEGPGRCGGRQVSAEGWTSQQVASTEPSSGVASYHAGVRLGSAGWLIASDGRGQHGV